MPQLYRRYRVTADGFPPWPGQARPMHRHREPTVRVMIQQCVACCPWTGLPPPTPVAAILSSPSAPRCYRHRHHHRHIHYGDTHEGCLLVHFAQQNLSECLAESPVIGETPNRLPPRSFRPSVRPEPTAYHSPRNPCSCYVCRHRRYSESRKRSRPLSSPSRGSHVRWPFLILLASASWSLCWWRRPSFVLWEPRRSRPWRFPPPVVRRRQLG